MRRKNISTGITNASAVIDLEENEDLVEEVTTTKRVGRQRRNADAPPAPTTPPSEVMDAEFADDDDETDDGPEFSDTSLAALIYSGGEERIENQYCTIAIRRNPDSMNDRFLTPCGANTNLPPLRNVELTADRMDIEERVRSEFGGGHYFFQIHFDNRLRSSWKSTLSDDPNAVQAARLAQDAKANPQPIPAPAAAPTDQVGSMIAGLRQMKELKDLLGDGDDKTLAAELTALRVEIAALKSNPAEPKSEKLSLLEMALAAPKAEVTDRLLNSMFPSEDKGRHWLADILSGAAELVAVGFDNKETIMPILGSLLGGGGIPTPTAAPQPQSFEDAMRQPPPTPQAPQLKTPTNFRRPRMPEAPEADNAPNAGNASQPPAPDEAAEVIAEHIPTLPVSVFIDQPEPLPLTSDGIDQTTDAAAIDAEDLSEPGAIATGSKTKTKKAAK